MSNKDVVEFTVSYSLSAGQNIQMEDVILPCNERVVTTTDARLDT